MVNGQLSGRNKSEMFEIIRKQGKIIFDVPFDSWHHSSMSKSKIKQHMGALSQEYKN